MHPKNVSILFQFHELWVTIRTFRLEKLNVLVTQAKSKNASLWHCSPLTYGDIRLYVMSGKKSTLQCHGHPVGSPWSTKCTSSGDQWVNMTTAPNSNSVACRTVFVVNKSAFTRGNSFLEFYNYINILHVNSLFPVMQIHFSFINFTSCLCLHRLPILIFQIWSPWPF